MKTAAVAFSGGGAALAERLDADIYLYGRDFDSLPGLMPGLWKDYAALVFFASCGIAVRAIAPHIKSKLTDPAVVVCDECGRYAVSLLSGHVGGANALAEEISGILGTAPVITTASDLHEVDRGRNLVLGIGCRRGLAPETVERAATIMLWHAKIPLSRVIMAATIDIKRGDGGLLGFINAHKLPVRFCTAQELRAVPGEFTGSDRVLSAVGVDNVCERAAVLCGGAGRLILKKTTRDGVAVAVFEKE